MIASQFDPEDLQTLEEILENEKRMHARKCSMCFALFASAVAVLIAAFIMVVITLAADLSGGGALGLEDIGEHAVLVQALGTLAGAVLLFFSIWCGAQNCVNSDRAHALRRAQSAHEIVRDVPQPDPMRR
ncbi:MAG: hypothetical protein NVV62_01930 [Terricaulis sp.]|nr:hypothetical protein [Terricaulis sp.]